MATTKKATAQQSQSKSTTAKKAGVKSRKPQAPTIAQVEKAYRIAIAGAKAQSVKPPMQPRVEFLKAILRAYAVQSLTEAGLTTSRADAHARRVHAVAVKAGSITADLVVFSDRVKETDGLGIVTDRPENTVRARLQGFCEVMGLPVDTFYAVRGEAYKVGEQSPVFIVRQ